MAALEAAGVADGWQAGQALDLAGAIDAGASLSGAARAALHRELRAVMAEALRGIDEPGSLLDTLREERARRRAEWGWAQ